MLILGSHSELVFFIRAKMSDQVRACRNIVSNLCPDRTWEFSRLDDVWHSSGIHGEAVGGDRSPWQADGLICFVQQCRLFVSHLWYGCKMFWLVAQHEVQSSIINLQQIILLYVSKINKWASSWQNQQNDLCAQRRLRSAWASAQSDQSLRCPHEESLDPQLPIEHTAKNDQTGRMPSVSWVFAAHIDQFVGFVMRRLKSQNQKAKYWNNLISLLYSKQWTLLFQQLILYSKQWTLLFQQLILYSKQWTLLFQQLILYSKQWTLLFQQLILYSKQWTLLFQQLILYSKQWTLLFQQLILYSKQWTLLFQQLISIWLVSLLLHHYLSLVTRNLSLGFATR